MALLTKKAIISTFEDMLREMPFDKISVTALVKRCGVSSNTFYYHYQDIYSLLDEWLKLKFSAVVLNESQNDWKAQSKKLLYLFKENESIINHVFSSLPRERLEQYVFTITDDVFSDLIREKIGNREVSEKKIDDISQFLRFAYLGFVLKFIWSGMNEDVEEGVDRLTELFEISVDALLEKYL